MSRLFNLRIGLVISLVFFGFGCDSGFSGDPGAARFSATNDSARATGTADSADGVDTGDLDANAADGEDGGGIDSGNDASGGKDSGEGDDELGMGGDGGEDSEGGASLEEFEEAFNSKCQYFDKENKDDMKRFRVDGGPPVDIDLSRYTLGRNGQFEGDDYTFSFKVYIVNGKYYDNLDDTPRNSKFKTKRYEAVITDARTPDCDITARAEEDTDDVREGCFLATTKITMADKTQKLVSEIRRGDSVYNPILDKAFEVTEIVRGNEDKAGMIEIGVKGNKVTVTSTHPFMTRSGVKQAQELSKFDEIVTADKTFARIEHLKHLPLDPRVQVANLTIGGSQGSEYAHMVLADGIVSGDLFLQQSTEQLRQQQNLARRMFVLQY